MLKLMYITNDPTVAKIAADAGVDRIFIDMEVLGKAERQGGMDTVQSYHVPEDIAKVRAEMGTTGSVRDRRSGQQRLVGSVDSCKRKVPVFFL